MRNFSFFIYFLTIITIIVDLISINLIQSKEKFNILVKLGIFDGYNHHSLTSFVGFILVISIVSCILLVISFAFIIKKLTSSYKTKFN
ncbi:hypothetical protein ACFX5K_03560 [Rickettsiales bacterium LUAb2]